MDTNETNDVRLIGRKSKLPLLLILAALAAALLAYAMWKSVQPAAVGDSTQEARSQDDLADDADTIAGIYAVGEVGELHNESFDIENATVASVVSDRVFSVTEEGNGQQLLVILDEDLDEGRAQVLAGQRVNLEGELKDFSQAPVEAGGDYTDAEAAAASGQRVYLHVTDLELR